MIQDILADPDWDGVLTAGRTWSGPCAGRTCSPTARSNSSGTAAVAARLRHTAHGSRRRHRRTAWRDPLAAYPNQAVKDSEPKRPQATKAAAAR